MQQAGFKILKAWDFDKFAVQTYRENIGGHVEQADIKELHIEDVPKADAWAFGFPCQDLSVAGKQAGIKLECTDCGEVWEVDYKNYAGKNACPECGGGNYRAATRSGMFFEIMRLLQEAGEKEPDKLPKILIAENVKALGPYLPVLAAEYGRAGYKSYYQLFNSKWWGVPQNRERYIVIGIRDDMEGVYRSPAEQHEWIPKLSSVIEKDVPESFYIDDEKARKIIDHALRKLAKIGSVHATITPDREAKRQNGRRAKEDEEEMFTLTARDLHGVIQKVFLTSDEIAYCCDASYYKGISKSSVGRSKRTHVVEYKNGKYTVRKLTPTEYGRLQGFPMDTWRQAVSNSQAYKQFGNAVTVPLAEAIGKSIIEFLEEQEAEDGNNL